MKALRKAPISVALGVILAGMAAPQMASAFSVNTEGNKISYKDSGDVLLFPFYSAVDGMQTWFSVTNTSDEESMAVKIRFREQKYSLDVWDTIVFLSPTDHFGFGVVNDGGVVKVMAAPGEDSCSLAPNFTNGVPANVKIPLEKNAFLPPSDWPAAADVGHVEVIAMADLSGATYEEEGFPYGVSLSEAIKAKTDQTWFENATGCDILKRAFLANPGGSGDGVEGISGAEEPGNNLIGRYVLTAPGSGIEAGENPIVLRKAMQKPYLVNQAPIPCNEEYCTSSYAWDKTELDHPHLGDLELDNLLAVDEQLRAGTLSGDWSVNPATNISLDWILSFPTKYVYSDVRDCVDFEGVNPGGKEWCAVNPYDGEAGNPWTGIEDKDGTLLSWSCLPISAAAYGLDEEKAVVTISPEGSDKLCNEVNVLTFNPVGNSVQPSMIQTEAYRTVIGIQNLPDVMGWAKLYLGWKERDSVKGSCDDDDDQEITSQCDQYDGPAATWGGLFIMRNGASASENNASLVELARGKVED